MADRVPRCPNAVMGAPSLNGHEVARSDEFDAYYCSFCGIWLESKCSDPNCDYCPKRPARPPLTQ